MILKIAWRNIWRNKIRSFTVIGSIIVGVWALIFLLAFSSGFVESYIRSAIDNEISHIQIHNPKYKDEKEAQYTLHSVAEIMETIGKQEAVEAATQRFIQVGMIANSKGSRGAQIRAVVPEQEAKLTKLDKKIVEGNYFGGETKNPIIISRRLAEKMGLKLKNKVVLTFQDTNGEWISNSFKIIGFYHLGNAMYEEMNVFVEEKNMTRLLGDQQMIHEIALTVKKLDQINTVKATLAKAFPDALVENYKEVAPDVNLYESQMSVSTTVIIVIVMLALIFGIINTMLMAVLERTRELGVLTAVGMKRKEVFGMIVLETLFLGLVAAPIGLFLGYLTVAYFGAYGLDLSSYSKGMEKFGLQSIVYTTLEISIFFKVACAVAITAILGALYPAFKATRLKPVEAIRKI